MSRRQIDRLALAQRLEDLAAAGVEQLPAIMVHSRPPAASADAPVAPPKPAVPPSPEAPPMPRISQPSLLPLDAIGDPERPRSPAGADLSETPTLAALNDIVRTCVACEELAATRTQTVFGVGNPDAKLCFLGEAPGADEDKQGEPFVGRGGQLLNKIIEACHLQREEVYILNVIKCRPPGNRNPHPVEAGNCRGYLLRQLQLIKPEFICCLGAVAAQNLLQTPMPIGKLRGQVHDYNGIKVVCTYHPAYLLRNPAAKKDCWEDMKFLMRQMGVEL